MFLTQSILINHQLLDNEHPPASARGTERLKLQPPRQAALAAALCPLRARCQRPAQHIRHEPKHSGQAMLECSESVCPHGSTNGDSAEQWAVLVRGTDGGFPCPHGTEGITRLLPSERRPPASSAHLANAVLAPDLFL